LSKHYTVSQDAFDTRRHRLFWGGPKARVRLDVFVQREVASAFH